MEIWKNRLGADFHKRNVEKIQNVMAQKGMDALILLNQFNRYYAVGFGFVTAERPAIVLIPQNDEPTLFVSQEEEGRIKYAMGVEDIEIFSEYPVVDTGQPIFKWLSERIEKLGFKGKTVGVEDNYTPVSDSACEPWFNQIKRYLDAKVVGAGSLVMELRFIKEPEEIAMMRKACEYADLMVQAISEEVQEDLTEAEIVGRARAKVNDMVRKELKEGVRIGGGMNARSDLSIKGGFMGFTGNNIVEKGNVCQINVGATVWMYHGESERCAVVGEPTEEMWRYFNIAMDSQLRSREATKPGVTCHEVDKASTDIIRNAGFVYQHGLGHGIGLQGHEPPWLREGVQTILKPGMCFTQEPTLLVEGLGSFRNSDTILVTKDGYESLTKYEGIHMLTLP